MGKGVPRHIGKSACTRAPAACWWPQPGAYSASPPSSPTNPSNPWLSLSSPINPCHWHPAYALHQQGELVMPQGPNQDLCWAHRRKKARTSRVGLRLPGPQECLELVHGAGQRLQPSRVRPRPRHGAGRGRPGLRRRRLRDIRLRARNLRPPNRPRQHQQREPTRSIPEPRTPRPRAPACTWGWRGEIRTLARFGGCDDDATPSPAPPAAPSAGCGAGDAAAPFSSSSSAAATAGRFAAALRLVSTISDGDARTSEGGEVGRNARERERERERGEEEDERKPRRIQNRRIRWISMAISRGGEAAAATTNRTVAPRQVRLCCPVDRRGAAPPLLVRYAQETQPESSLSRGTARTDLFLVEFSERTGLELISFHRPV